MKVLYVPQLSVDCTSDPHPVQYDAQTTMELRVAMLSDIVAICTSDMVQAIRSVRGKIGQSEYESDYYSDWDGGGDRKKAVGDMAEKHKGAGLYFARDWGPYSDTSKHLPQGLPGLEAFVQKVYEAGPNVPVELSVGVVWAFAGSASCSDYIEMGGERGEGEVNYGSQDWWTENENYLPWCQQMADFLGQPFPYGRGAPDMEDGYMEPQGG